MRDTKRKVKDKRTEKAQKSKETRWKRVLGERRETSYMEDGEED